MNRTNWHIRCKGECLVEAFVCVKIAIMSSFQFHNEIGSYYTTITLVRRKINWYLPHSKSL